jgi:hypothetical protein
MTKDIVPLRTGKGYELDRPKTLFLEPGRHRVALLLPPCRVGTVMPRRSSLRHHPLWGSHLPVHMAWHCTGSNRGVPPERSCIARPQFRLAPRLGLGVGCAGARARLRPSRWSRSANPWLPGGPPLLQPRRDIGGRSWPRITGNQRSHCEFAHAYQTGMCSL